MITSIKHHGFLVVFAEEGRAPRQWGPRGGWDTIWTTMAEAEDCTARARDALSGLAARIVNHDRTIAVSRGPRQIDGSMRLYGYLDSLTQRAAQRAEDQDRLVRNTGSHDARSPDVIVDVDLRRERWEPARGEGRLAAAIARAAIRGEI
jgi:hypothetical protein